MLKTYGELIEKLLKNITNGDVTQRPTNLINQYVNKNGTKIPQQNTIPSSNTQNSQATSVSPASNNDYKGYIPSTKVTTEEPSAALNLFDKKNKDYKGYIPSSKVDTVDAPEELTDKQVDEILKQSDGLLAELRKSGI